ncbi:hypothetical protein BT63DRAFT_61139 [Microthyrium microscopicum]|uniref:Uncharacterized protein n=1 Tax=Microthyrium microscopicum TaxID=703497 RepID=A0A6A6TZ04_9PEZI|nr:hypothetical protein BT63DRAFT_61139 [Microthyrium microscopicum]
MSDGGGNNTNNQTSPSRLDSDDEDDDNNLNDNNDNDDDHDNDDDDDGANLFVQPNNPQQTKLPTRGKPISNDDSADTDIAAPTSQGQGNSTQGLVGDRTAKCKAKSQDQAGPGAGRKPATKTSEASESGIRNSSESCDEDDFFEITSKDDWQAARQKRKGDSKKEKRRAEDTGGSAKKRAKTFDVSSPY